MPDFKDKKTLDEILSDLNKILDRMPDLTQKFKAPEIKPIDFSSIMENKIVIETKNSQKTENIQSFAGEEKSINELHLAGDSEKASNLDHGKTLQTDLPPQETALSDAAAIVEVQQDNRLSEYETQDKAGDLKESIENTEDKILGNTADFGVPDIDFLVNLEQSYGKAEIECKNDQIDFQNQPEKKDLDGGEMEDKIQGKEDSQAAQENLQTNEKMAQLEPEITLSLNDIPTEPLSKNNLLSNKENSSLDSEISLQAELEKIHQLESEIINETAEKQDNNGLSEKTIVIESSEINFQKLQKQENSILNLDLDLNLDSTVEQKQQQEQVYEKPSDMADELEKFTLAVNGSNPNTANSSHQEDKTLVFEPSLLSQQGETSDSQERKTLVFSLDETNKIPQFDRDLSMNNPPCEIPSERIKNVGFIFSDRNMLNHVLKILDEICFTSKNKPMFINRSFLFEYNQEFNSNLINQKAAEASCQAVVAVGELSYEKVYELETVFSSAGIIFRYFKHLDFSKSQAIDFILDLIAK